MEERWWLAGLGAATVVMAFGSLGAPLLEPTEARYALIPAEMLASGHWLSPALFGEPYLDKPPLLYWLVMGSYGVAGVSDWAARIPASCCALAAPWVGWAWLRLAVGPRAGLLAAWVLCLCPRAAYYMGMLAMDGPLGLAILATLATLHLAATARNGRGCWWVLAWASAMAGMLAKGPVVLVGTAPVALAAAALTGSWKPFVPLLLWLAAVLAATAGCAWMLEAASPGFALSFFLRQNVERFTSPFDHAGPWWFHLQGLAIGLLPWGPVALWTWWKSHGVPAKPARPGAAAWLGLSLALSLVVFSVAGSKRPSYGTAFLPQACLLIGLVLDRCLPPGWLTLRSPGNPTAQVLTWVSIPLLAGIGWMGWALGWTSPVWIPALTLIALAGLWAAWRLGCRCDLGLALATVVLAFGHSALLWGHHDTFSPRKGLDWLSRNRPKTTLVCFPHPFEGIQFYAKGFSIARFGPNQTAELAGFMRHDNDATLVAKGNKLPSELLHALGFTPGPATPFKSTPWLMKKPATD